MLKIDIQKNLQGANGTMQLNIQLEVQEGEFLAIMGESGSGKTTLLRALAGLQKTQGSISFKEEVWLSSKVFISPQKRSLAFAFQDYALFENMTVLQNLLFVNHDKALAQRLLRLCELLELQDAYPSSLSGGQKQRVSFSRTLMQKPQLLLLDEPFSALDTKMRKKLQEALLAFHKEFSLTTIMVSHDPSEIYRLTKRVLTLHQGEVHNDGETKEILLKQNGSQKFSFDGELLEIKKVDVVYVGVIAVGQQIVEVVLSKNEAKNLQVGQKLQVGTKAFTPTVCVS